MQADLLLLQELQALLPPSLLQGSSRPAHRSGATYVLIGMFPLAGRGGIPDELHESLIVHVQEDARLGFEIHIIHAQER